MYVSASVRPLSLSLCGARAHTQVTAVSRLLAPRVKSHRIAATVTENPDSLLARAVGDLFVRVEATKGAAGDHGDTTVLGGIHHNQLQNHPRVYELIRAALESTAGTALAGPPPAGPE